MTPTFDKIAAGLVDATAFAEGDTTRGRVATPLDAKDIRKATKKTRAKFADTYRLPIGTVRE